jgi:hypothetical protein
MNRILKQYKANRLSILMGAAKEMVGRMSTYQQAASLTMVSLMFWDSPVMLGVRNMFPWLELWSFIVIAICGLLTILIWEYAFVMPGSYAFSTRQFLTHENKMARDIEAIKKKLGIKDEEVSSNNHSN